MDNNPFFKQVFRVGLLWGYSDLFEKLYGEVQPALVEEHEKKRESEKEKQRGTTMDHGSNVPEVVKEDEDNTLSAPPQFSPPIPFDDGSGPVGLVQTDSKDQPIDHPPTPIGRLSTTATATTEALEPTSDCPILQQVTGEADTSRDEIEEVPGPSTPSDNDEKLRVVQSKEEE